MFFGLMGLMGCGWSRVVQERGKERTRGVRLLMRSLVLVLVLALALAVVDSYEAIILACFLVRYHFDIV